MPKFSALQQEFDLALEANLEPLQAAFGATVEASKYALFSGGKRIRPLLLLSTLDSFSFPYTQAIDAAISLEFIHTYSLIHDDLPAIDNDDFRRGIPTVHRKYNEATAILAGDFLLTYAFETLANAPYADSLKIKLIQTLAKASGPFGMIGGQTMDLHYEGKDCSLQTLEKMHLLKTGALIAASLEFAAYFLKKDPKPFTELGNRVGLAFQIKNDLEDERKSDLKNNKATFLSKTNDPFKRLTEEQEHIAKLLEKTELHHSPLQQVIDTILKKKP